MHLRSIVLSAFAAVACRGGEGPRGADSAIASADTAPPAPPPDFPPTNDGLNVRKNLDAEIDMYEKRPEVASLVPRLAQRGMFYGRIADRERALELADAWVKQKPEAQAFFERASLRSAFHRFDEALADLKRSGGTGEGIRAEILMATGRPDEALALREDLAARGPNVITLGALGVALGELGRADEADRKLLEALKTHRNTSPFPVAWIQFQRGLIWEQEGEYARAGRLYDDAVARLPGYAAATSHLAGVHAIQGDRVLAERLLRSLLSSSDDPEYVAQLAALLRGKGGEPTEADALAARAKARYEELLSRHPLAFAAHAARFYLGEGRDPARAGELAERAKAPELLVEARLAQKDLPGACKAAVAGLARPHGSKQQLAVYWRAFSACKDDQRAAEVDARLKSAGGR